MAKTDAAAALAKALEQQSLEALALLKEQTPGTLERLYGELLKGGVKTRELTGLRQAVNQTHKRQ
jgi:hypothetical protein